MSLLKEKILAVMFGLLVLNPTVAFAQSANNSLPVYKNVDSTLTEYLCTPQGDGNDLPRCINKLYRFGVVIGALTLVFFVVWAGYLYITGGETGKMKGKGMIINCLVGMGLLLGSYTLLRFINPDLVAFKPIQPPIFQANNLASCEDLGFGKGCVIADGHNMFYDVGTGTLGPCKSGFRSDAEARQVMETFQVDTWAKSGSQKVPKKRSVTVQNCIADKVKAAFATIYSSPEKFPINTLESYNFRLATGSGTKLSAHGMGLALDINDNENYYICISSSCSTKQVGSFWKPCPQSGCSEYSMPANGSVVTAFKSQGLGWGGDWNSLKDYMHFSCYPSEHAHCF